MPIPYGLIGFTGRAGSGKDTACDYAVSDHNATKFAFADPLRKIALSIDPVVGWSDGDSFHYSQALEGYGYAGSKELFPEFRRFLQRLGTEGLRDNVDQDFWVNLAEREILGHLGSADSDRTLMVISDVRFANEAEMIRHNGGIIVRVDRGEDGLTEGLASHASETELESIDADLTIMNNGPFDQLFASVDTAVAVAFERSRAAQEEVMA